MNLPAARIADLLEQEADNDLLVYDLRFNKAFSLNETSKNVFKACHRKLTFDDLKRRYKYSDDLIHLALDELKTSDLIEDYQNTHFAGLSRREVIRKVGLATMVALPVIIGLTAPGAIHAASSCAADSCNCNCTFGNPGCTPGDTCTAVGSTLCANAGCTCRINTVPGPDVCGV